MNKNDLIYYKVEEDGTITFSTDAVSGQNHVSADEFLEYMKKMCGGTVTTTKRKKPFNAAGHGHHRGRKAF